VTEYNPKYLLLLGVLENLMTIILGLYYKTSIKYIVYFIFVMIVMKIIPLYFSWNNKNNFTSLRSDLTASISVFVLYSFWLYFNGTDVISIQRRIIDSIIEEKNETPILWLVNAAAKKLNV
jgi:hypothetical protein